MYEFLKAVGTPLSNILYNHEVTGLENLPEGPAILASNHLAFVDSIFIPQAVGPKVHFLAKSDYFTTPGIKGAAMRQFFTRTGQLPMDRSGGSKSAESLQAGLDILAEGGYLGIYPEGTRSPDGRFYRPKTGVARLAMLSGAPVIPVGQIGTDLVQRAGSNRPHARYAGQKITVKTIIGKPLDFWHYASRAEDYSVQRGVADRIGEAIRELTGQAYVDVDAAKVKALMKSENLTARQASEQLLAEKA